MSVSSPSLFYWNTTIIGPRKKCILSRPKNVAIFYFHIQNNTHIHIQPAADGTWPCQICPPFLPPFLPFSCAECIQLAIPMKKYGQERKAAAGHAKASHSLVRVHGGISGNCTHPNGKRGGRQAPFGCIWHATLCRICPAGKWQWHK